MSAFLNEQDADSSIEEEKDLTEQLGIDTGDNFQGLQKEFNHNCPVIPYM